MQFGLGEFHGASELGKARFGLSPRRGAGVGAAGNFFFVTDFVDRRRDSCLAHVMLWVGPSVFLPSDGPS